MEHKFPEKGRVDADEFVINWPKVRALAPLVERQVHVWAVDCDHLRGGALISANILSADEIQRANRFRFERDKLRFTAARAAIRIIFGHYLQTDPAEIRFEYGARGKPAIANKAPGGSLHFNLTHSKGLALLALTSACPVGIDLEQIKELNDLETLAARYFSSDENAALKALQGRQRLEAFYDIWTRKEAWLKATGEGITGHLERVEVLSRDKDITAATVGGDLLLSLPGRTLQRLDPAMGFKAALAYPSNNLGLVAQQWSAELNSF